MSPCETTTHFAPKPRYAEDLNASGFEPLDLRVLVLPDPPENQIGSILLPESTKEQERMAMMYGTLVAVGENAWHEAVYQARARGEVFTPPTVGDRVVFAKYGGTPIKGKDKREYRLMNDEDVIGREQEK